MSTDEPSPSEEEVLRTMAADAGIGFQAKVDCPPKSLLDLIPKQIAEKYGVFPLDFTDIKSPQSGKTIWRIIKIAMTNPYDVEALDALQHLLNAEIEAVVVPRGKIVEGIRNYYGS